MPINDIALAGGMRNDLVSLQLISALQARTTERLSTGKRVNSATDDPAAYFASQDHMSAANDLASAKDGMSEALQTVESASNGIKGITSLIEQAKGIVSSARSANTTDRATLATQFDALRTQIDQLASDASYKGTNLLAANSSLTVNFNADGSSAVTVTGFDGTSAGLGINASANQWAGNADLDAALTDLNNAEGTLRVNGSQLAANNGVITARQSFTSDMINTLTTGADQLTAADPNQEGANLLALQTRQQLGIVALQLSNQSQQSILRLF